MVVPEGFTLPPLLYLAVVLFAFCGAVAMLWALDPPISDRTVLALSPWMMLGAAFHVIYNVDIVPSILRPLFGAPTVYLTTAAIAGSVWIAGCFLVAGGLQRSIDRFLGTVGAALTGAVILALLYTGWIAGTLSPLWPMVAVFAAAIVTACVWFLVSLRAIDITTVTGVTGVVVVFGHTLDGISTAVGYDLLGATEEVPASRFILEMSDRLPTAEYIGAGWLFILIKIALAVGILWLFIDFVREEPRRSRLILAFMAAVGLGPGTHNVLLFLVGPL